MCYAWTWARWYSVCMCLFQFAINSCVFFFAFGHSTRQQCLRENGIFVRRQTFYAIQIRVTFKRSIKCCSTKIFNRKNTHNSIATWHTLCTVCWDCTVPFAKMITTIRFSNFISIEIFFYFYFVGHLMSNSNARDFEILVERWALLHCIRNGVAQSLWLIAIWKMSRWNHENFKAISMFLFPCPTNPHSTDDWLSLTGTLMHASH